MPTTYKYDNVRFPGEESLVNTNTAGTQGYSQVAVLEDGGWVIVWVDYDVAGGDGSGSSIKAQLYNSTGVKAGAEILVNSSFAGTQDAPVVAALTGGGFVVSWSDESGTLGDTDTRSVKAQVFDNSGSKTGDEFLVNTTTLGSQFAPAIAPLDNGGFVVTWVDHLSGIRAQVYAADGTRIGTQFEVNTTTEGREVNPSIATLANGDFVIAWGVKGIEWDYIPSFARFQRFTADGTKLGGETVVAESSYDEGYETDVTALADGGFVVIVRDEYLLNILQSRQYGAGGTAVTALTFLGHSYNGFSAAGLETGGYTVVFQSYDGDFGGIYAKFFSATASQVGGDFFVNAQTDGYRALPAIAYAGSGKFVVTWTDGGGAAGDPDTGVVSRIMALGATVSGDDSGNYLTGGDGNDTLTGGAGDDILDGGAGDDIMTGGAGDDTYYVRDAGDVVNESAGEGIDFVEAFASFTLPDHVEKLRLHKSASYGAGNDLDNTISASPARGPVEIHGGGGNDNIRASVYADVVYGDDGNDTIFGDNGDDYIDGGAGDDRLTGGAGNDEMHGGTGDDYMIGNRGNDIMHGGDGGDVLIGSEGMDTLHGGSGNDLLRGGADNDTLYGGADRDQLFGDAGDDVLWGGAGQDFFTGGLGADRFMFDEPDMNGTANGLADRIRDFKQIEGDLIDLSAIDAILGGDDDAFTFIGSAAFSGTAGELRFQQNATGNFTAIQMDVDGDGKVDYVIVADGLVNFTASDFVL